MARLSWPVWLVYMPRHYTHETVTDLSTSGDVYNAVINKPFAALTCQRLALFLGPPG